MSKKIERELIASALEDKQVKYYLRSRLKPEAFENSEARVAWTKILAGQETEELKNSFVGENRMDVSASMDALNIVLLNHTGRQLEKLCRQSLTHLQKNDKNLKNILKWFGIQAARITVPTQNRALIKSPEEWVDEGYQAIMDRFVGKKQRTLDLGIPGLTEALLVEPSNLMIIAAETGKGKTAFALNIATHLGINQEIPTLYLNTEMSAEELELRLYSISTKVGVGNLRSGAIKTSDIAVIEEFRDFYRVKSNKLYISDALPYLTTEDIVAFGREYAVEAGIKVLVVDYIQRLAMPQGEEQWKFLLEASKTLKSLAQELDVLVIMVAQLTDDDKLAGARGMKRDVDVFLKIVEQEEPGELLATHTVKIEKSRHTETGGELELTMDRSTLKFYAVSEPVKSEWL